ncbi:MAG: 4'-phosphopantetheinyl transferase superfamily protein, partial [Deltaproteobacteria bacterium]
PGLSPNDVYQRYFHGPAFQVLGQVSVLGENGGDALTQTERPVWLRGHGHNDFATMPYAREAGFQIAGLWEMVEMGRMALPSGVDVIQLTPKEARCVPHRVMARRRLSQTDTAVFDIWTLDADGAVIDLMLGYRTVVLRALTQSERFEPFAHALWPKQLRPTSLVLPLDRVEPLLLDSASPGLDHFLAASELTRLAGFSLPKRRLEWLGARIAAKRLIRETLFGRSGATVPYNAITIERDELGAPVVSIVGDAEPPPRISLSHSDKLAVAFLSPSPEVRCGVDVESVQTRDPSFAQTYFSAREQDQAKRAEDTAYALTEMWAVKEAVLKALGLGARVDFRDVEALSGTRGWQVVLHQGAERRAHDLKVGACQVEVERHPTRVIARVLLPNDGTVLPANLFTSNLEVRA